MAKQAVGPLEDVMYARGERSACRTAYYRARKAGQRWGGSKPGIRKVVQERTVKRMKRDGATISDISRAVGLSRPTVYALLKAQ